jgi:hypothetical protein
MSLARVAAIRNLKTARTLALDDNFAMQPAQFDLANVAASGIDLLRDQGRAFRASARFALRNVTASVDANFCRSGIEVRLKHTRAAQTVRLRSWRGCRQAHYSAPRGNLRGTEWLITGCAT